MVVSEYPERQHGAEYKQKDQLTSCQRQAQFVVSAAIVSHSSQGTSAPTSTGTSAL